MTNFEKIMYEKQISNKLCMKNLKFWKELGMKNVEKFIFLKNLKFLK